MKIRSILLSLAFALVAAPMAGAYHPHNLPVQQEAIHGYGGAGGVARESMAYDGKPAPAATIVWDGHEGATGIYDGDTEQGSAGGRFIVSTADATYGCMNDPAETPHHVNNEVWAEEFIGGSIVYSAGSEGWDATSIGECISNGIISDDPYTDPNDCASGETGVYELGIGIWRPATIRPNTLTAPPCGSFDGDVWGFIHSGVFTLCDTTVTSTPVQGHIWTS